jgi:hypothetical protein
MGRGVWGLLLFFTFLTIGADEIPAEGPDIPPRKAISDLIGDGPTTSEDEIFEI